VRLNQPRQQEESIRDGLRHTQSYLTDGYYRQNVKPTDFDGASSAQIDGLVVRSFATGVDTTDRASVFKPQYWINGQLNWSFRWATSSTSTNTVNLTVTIYSYDLDDNTSNRTTIHTSTFNVTPSGTANYLKSHDLSGTTALDADADVIAIEVTRNGNTGDTNPDAFYLGPAYLEYYAENIQ
jgi:hypothetical protein